MLALPSSSSGPKRLRPCHYPGQAQPVPPSPLPQGSGSQRRRSYCRQLEASGADFTPEPHPWCQHSRSFLLNCPLGDITQLLCMGSVRDPPRPRCLQGARTENMTRFFLQSGIDFPLLIPEESGDVVERPRMRETLFIPLAVLALDEGP